MKQAVSTATVLVCCFTLICSSPAFAQEMQFDGIEFRRAPLEGEVRLSLNRSIELALENNPGLVVEKLRVEQASAGIEEERGTYDPVFDISGLVGRRDNVIASRFFPTGEFVEEDTIYGARLNGITHLGSRYGIGLNYQRQLSTSNTQSLSPQYGATMDLTFSQPLLRDFGRGVALTELRIAQSEQEISEENLAIGVSAAIFQVVQSYWNLVFVREDLEVRRTSLALAEALLEQNESLLGSGQVAEVSVYEARAGVFERQEDVIRFENEVARAEDFLKVLLYADLETVSLIPGDVLEESSGDVNPGQSYDRAVTRRPEILSLQTEIEQRGHEANFATNQTRPRLDLNLQYGMSGLSGRPNSTFVNPDSPELGRAGDTVAGSVLAGITRPLGAFRRFFSGDGFDSWSVELRMELPIRNRTANARLSEATLRERESKATLAAVRERVVLEVRDSLRNLATAGQSMDAAREGIRAVEEQLIATRVRFDAGLTTSYEVLRVLDSLAQARRRELRALVDHNVAWPALKLAEGSILEEYNVQVRGSSRAGEGEPF